MWARPHSYGKIGAGQSAAQRRYGAGERRNTMPAIDEEPPKKKISHEIGQDLTCCRSRNSPSTSISCARRLRELEADIARKQATRSAADAFFKK